MSFFISSHVYIFSEVLKHTITLLRHYYQYTLCNSKTEAEKIKVFYSDSSRHKKVYGAAVVV